MSLILAQNPAKRKTQFTTVVPMYAATEQRRTRPQIIVCPECGGTRRLEYVNPDTFEVETMPCIFCEGSGHFTRNASHAEHRSLLERMTGFAWSVVKAVIL